VKGTTSSWAARIASAGVGCLICIAAMAISAPRATGGVSASGTTRPATSTPDPRPLIPATRSLDRERVLAGEREQERIATATSAVAGRILDLLKTMRANRAADAESLDRWDRAVRELTALGQQNMARVVTALRRARLGPDEQLGASLRTASLEQREILWRLLALLRAIEKRVVFARLVDSVEQLIRDQGGVKQQTVDAARQTLGKPPADLTDAERERLSDLKDEQEAIRERYDGVRDSMERLEASAAAAAAQDDAAAAREAAAVKRGLQAMRTDQPERAMRRAALDLAEAKPVSAAEAQEQARRKLQRLRDLLRRDDSARQRRLDAALADLDQLIRRQSEVKRETRRLKPDAPAAALHAIAKAQNPITHATGRLAKTVEPASGGSRKAAESLTRAQTAQRKAEKRLADRRPADAVARQQDAIDRMREAKAALEARRDEVARRLAEPAHDRASRLERATADLDRLAADQDRARQAAQRMADLAKQGSPASTKQLDKAAADQRALGRRTEALAREMQRHAPADREAAEAGATRTLNAALKHQDAAADRLDRKRPDQAAPEQQKAVTQLRRAATGLRHQLNLAKQAQDRARALQQVLARQDRAMDELGEAARRQRDLDEVLAEQRALRAATGDLDARMKPRRERRPLPLPKARREAAALAARQRDLGDQTGRLGDAMADLDRDAATALDKANARQAAAARHLDGTKPTPAGAEQDRAVEALAAARKHLAKKLDAIVKLLKTLEARREDLARAAGQPEEPEPERQGRGGVTIDDLLKMAGALVDIDRLRTRQRETKRQTEAEGKRPGTPTPKPDPAASGRWAS